MIITIILLKNFVSFDEIFSSHEFDYVFRTNTSSFIDLRKFETYILKNTDSLDYAGSVLKAEEGDLIGQVQDFFK